MLQNLSVIEAPARYSLQNLQIHNMAPIEVYGILPYLRVPLTSYRGAICTLSHPMLLYRGVSLGYGAIRRVSSYILRSDFIYACPLAPFTRLCIVATSPDLSGPVNWTTKWPCSIQKWTFWGYT